MITKLGVELSVKETSEIFSQYIYIYIIHKGPTFSHQIDSNQTDSQWYQTVWSQKECHIPRTEGPRRLSFSQFLVLMSTTFNYEEMTLLN